MDLIAYKFTETELRFLCEQLGNIKPWGIFTEGGALSADECRQAMDSLRNKGFVAGEDSSASVNSVIALLIRSLGRAQRILVGAEEGFTAYICENISLLLIKDGGEGRFLLYPFQSESSLSEWLGENGIYQWDTLREEKFYNGKDNR